ncbi:MAG: trypsin-like peptidase domain-containing protein [Terriglobales bacterium]
MRTVRRILLAIMLAAVFYLYTTHRAGVSINPVKWTHFPEKVELTEAAEGNQSLDPEERTTIAVYKKVLPSVVNVTSTAVAFNFFYGLMPQKGQGTGFVIDRQGHILTNFHVVEGARLVEVTLYNRKKYKAEIVGQDQAHDLAVIQISAPSLTPAVLGDSRGLEVGQFVYAIGNPFGLNGSMSRGIVSSVRSIQTPEGANIDEAIQTDAAINPGNSGGPLLNSRGEVIGINAMIATSGAGQSAGVGFAIPINTAKAVLNDLVTLGRVRRPSLGVQNGLPIGPELAAELGLPADFGVLIMQLTPGGAAEQAGLRGGNQRMYLGNMPILVGGDLIVDIDGTQIEDLQDIARVMTNHRAGDTVTLTVYRGKKQINVKVVLSEARQQV